MGDLKDKSRGSFTYDEKTGSVELVQLGVMQRIADATESIADSSKAMAKNHIQLQDSLNWYKTQYNNQSDRIEELKRSNRGYKAANTRLKNQLAAEKLKHQSNENYN